MVSERDRLAGRCGGPRHECSRPTVRTPVTRRPIDTANSAASTAVAAPGRRSAVRGSGGIRTPGTSRYSRFQVLPIPVRNGPERTWPASSATPATPGPGPNRTELRPQPRPSDAASTALATGPRAARPGPRAVDLAGPPRTYPPIDTLLASRPPCLAPSRRVLAVTPVVARSSASAVAQLPNRAQLPAGSIDDRWQHPHRDWVPHLAR